MKVRVTIATKGEAIPVGEQITLRKEKDNQFDSEAIAVIHNGQPNGYVSAYYKTRKPDTVSAGYIHGRFGDEIEGVVVAEGIAEVDLRTTITLLD